MVLVVQESYGSKCVEILKLWMWSNFNAESLFENPSNTDVLHNHWTETSTGLYQTHFSHSGDVIYPVAVKIWV